MDREPIGPDRLPPLGGLPSRHLRKLKIPPQPRRDGAGLAGWTSVMSLCNGIRGDQPSMRVPQGPEPRQQRGKGPSPWTADPAPRGCSAVAAAQRALAADAPAGGLLRLYQLQHGRQPLVVDDRDGPPCMDLAAALRHKLVAPSCLRSRNRRNT
jgi:hypothetical protein